MNTTETELENMEHFLETHAFTYRGCGTWHDAVTSLIHPTSIAYKILKQRISKPTWSNDSLGDFITTIDREDGKQTRGRIVKCWWPLNSGNERWLLLVNDQFYGFWHSCREAKQKFGFDCISNPDCKKPNK